MYFVVDFEMLFLYTIYCRSTRAVHGSLAQLGEHLPYKQGVVGSSPTVPTKDFYIVKYCNISQCIRSYIIKASRSEAIGREAKCSALFGPVVQLVRMLACHARGRGFEPLPGRQQEYRSWKYPASVFHKPR